MEDFCFFCCEICNKLEKEGKELLKKFFKFLYRHLNNYGESNEKNQKDYGTCEKCIKIAKSFCDLYHDLKTIELLLNWQLWSLIEVMNKRNVLNNINSENDEQSDNILMVQKGALQELRNDLISQCSKKLKSSYPHVLLQKMSPYNVQVQEWLSNSSAFKGKLKFGKYPQSKRTRRKLLSKPVKVNHAFKYYKTRVQKSIKILRKFYQKKKRTKTNIRSKTVKTIIKFEPELHIFDTPELIESQLHSSIEVKLLKIDQTELTKIEQSEQPLSISDTLASSPSQIEEIAHSEVTKRNLRTVHKCTTCNKTFSTAQSLLVHIDNSGCFDNLKEVESPVNEVDEEVDQIEPDHSFSSSEEDESFHSDCSDEEDIQPKKKENNSRKFKTKKENKIKLEKSETESDEENNKKEYLIVKNKNGRLQCCFCSRSYPPKGPLRAHILSQHPKKWHLAKFPRKQNVRFCNRFKCPNCDELFEKAHSLLLHWKKEHEKSQEAESSAISVEIVSFTTLPNSEVYKILTEELKKPKHIAKVEISVPREILTCEEKNCARPFYSKEDLEVHKTLHGTFSCGVSCSETKSFLPELAVHELKCKGRKRSNPNDLNCPRCDFKSTDYSAYLRHYCSEHFSLKFLEHSCPVCKTYVMEIEQSNHRHDLFDHLQHYHNLDKLKFSKSGIIRCDEKNCTGYFMKLFSLDYHKKVDHGVSEAELKKVRKARMNVCETCGKAFPTEAYLRRHLLVHSGPESWEFCCEVCSKKCITENKLNEHMRMHTKEKPFVCEVCGIKYAHRHNLRIHVNSKHGDVVQDIPQRYNTSNLTSKKGIKRKTTNDNQSMKKRKLKQKPSMSSE